MHAPACLLRTASSALCNASNGATCETEIGVVEAFLVGGEFPYCLCVEVYLKKVRDVAGPPTLDNLRGIPSVVHDY